MPAPGFNRPFVVLTILAAGIVLFFYGKILFSPNDYFFSDEGDGLKNYYTYAWHVRYDTSYTNFTGMNYPYGENIFYTDGHPILANSLKFLSSVFPSIQDHSIGILNMLMIGSIFLTFLVLFLLMRELGIEPWFAVLFSLIIGLMAPQVQRLTGHFALSYSLALPFSWWLWLKAQKRNGAGVMVFLLINNLFWMLVHAYLGMIVIAFLAGLWFFESIYRQWWKHDRLKFFGLMISIVVPLVIFNAMIHATNIHTGRTDNPSGFFLYGAEPDDLLVPPIKPLSPLFDLISGGRINLKWEARSYLGFSFVVLLAILVVMALKALVYHPFRSRLREYFDHAHLNIALVAALLSLLFAMSFPFRQIPWLLDLFPIFKQFRATGRFTWPFYFAFTVFGAYCFQRIFTSLRQNGKSIWAYILIGSVGIIGLVEGLENQAIVSEGISGHTNGFNQTHVPEIWKTTLSAINPHDYQAILALPFYHFGSESFARPVDGNSLRQSVVLAYQTGLPLVNAALTRISKAESKNIIQLISPNYYPKLIEREMFSDKPLLILNSGNIGSKYERSILRKGRSLVKTSAFELLAISVNDLFKDDSREIFSEYERIHDRLEVKMNFEVTDATPFLYYDDFERQPTDLAFRGRGSFLSVKRGQNILAEIQAEEMKPETEYHLSIWMYNGEPDALNLWFRLMVEQWDTSGNMVYSTVIFPEQAETIDGDWSLVEGTFTVLPEAAKIRIITEGSSDAKARLLADDLLIRAEGVEVYRNEEGNLFYNNHDVSAEW